LNPRLYGSLALTVRAGASLPALWCDVLLGRPVIRKLARPGVCYRWEEGEARNFVAFARRGSWRAAVDVLRPRRNCAHADFSRRDPGPLAARALLIARRAARNARSGASGDATGEHRPSKAPAGRIRAERSGQPA